MIAAMRLLLACAGLIIIAVDPTEPDRHVTVTYGALILYVLYSAFFYLGVSAQWPVARRLMASAHWQDVAWYTLLIALSSGTHSIFFFGFYFSILVASFRLGFAVGMRTTLVSAALFLAVGYWTTSEQPGFELNRFLLRPTYMVILGYLVAHWGGREILLKRRLALLREVSVVSNPRFGVNRTIGSIMERVRAFYGADSCHLLVFRGSTSEYQYRRADASRPGGNGLETMAPELARRLMDPLGDCAVVHRRESPGNLLLRGRHYAWDVERWERAADLRDAAEDVAALLDARSYVSIPVRRQGRTVGRAFVVSRSRMFHDSDAEFLLQLAEQVMPAIENIRLLDGMASSAADVERRRIARDLHDSIVQSYIGIQLGLIGLKQKYPNGEGPGAPEIERLIGMASESAEDARRYVFRLRTGGEADGTLAAALRRYADRFQEASHIEVEVDMHDDVEIRDRLAAEVFQMAVEGLSNIRRHTRSTKARVAVERLGDRFRLRVENEVGADGPAADFRPASIGSRAEALGGSARVDVSSPERTVVEVEIPL